jgi:hypothetical protein
MDALLARPVSLNFEAPDVHPGLHRRSTRHDKSNPPRAKAQYSVPARRIQSNPAIRTHRENRHNSSLRNAQQQIIARKCRP